MTARADDLVWETVVGQDRAVGQLRRSVQRPVHAYLLVGPRGSGIAVAARCFAAELVGAPDERARSLVRRGVHPDVVEFEPTTNTYTLANEVREPRPGETYRRDRSLPRIIPEIHKAPVEGDRKVVLLHDADRMEDAVANALLKSIEEPPPRTIVVLLTERPDSMLATIRSRCQRVDFGFVDVVRPEPLERVRSVFADVVSRVDGTGAGGLALAQELQDAVGEASAAREEAADAELAELEDQIERSGYPTRTAQSLRRRLADRHRQELRRARTDALAEGIGAIETVYLGGLADADPAVVVDPRAAGRALDACREARRAFEFNPNEALLLERLVLHLPPVAAGRPR